MPVTGSSSVTSGFGETSTASLVGGGASYDAKEIASNQYGSGTGANQVDRMYTFSGTIAASTPLVIDLTSFTDPLTGATGQAMARARHIQVQNLETNDTHVLLMGYATTTANAWTGLLSNPGQINIRPGTLNNTLLGPGVFQADAPSVTGWLVGGSSKLLQFDPGANAILVKIIITGCSV